ncbi:MAG: hypothetical protein ACRDG2_07185, partial [Actinomycetota bacterium]
EILLGWERAVRAETHGDAFRSEVDVRRHAERATRARETVAARSVPSWRHRINRRLWLGVSFR